MQSLRQTLLKKELIPLTEEESQNYEGLITNETWQAKHRPDPLSHPYAQFSSSRETHFYHLFSDPEDTAVPELHWKSKKLLTNTFWGYNPTMEIINTGCRVCKIYMFLPIYQRYYAYYVQLKPVEIFDGICREYSEN